MPDELLDDYNRELAFIRQLSGRFAEAHPKINERLRLDPFAPSDDPHVERLIEAFAYLTARIRRKLDDEFPEIVGSLLDVLYPHYQAPVPSMAVVQFKLDPSQSQTTTGALIEKHTELETDPIDGEPCRFRTGYPVTLWPLEVRRASLAPAPLPAPSTRFTDAAQSVLVLSLGVMDEAARFSELEVDTLRFFLRGQPQQVNRLYEFLFNHALGVAVADSAGDPRPVVLGREAIRPVGFDREEGLLPYPARSFLGYRLLTEYFAFPSKFLFLDLAMPAPERLADLGPRAEIYIYLDRPPAELARVVNAETFLLGCTPIVNLYSQRAEPIALTQADYEYQVVPDRRRPLAHEVFSIDRVIASEPQGDVVEYQPFFSIRHARDRETARTFWHAGRRGAIGNVAAEDRGTDVFISLVDLGFRPSVPAGWTLSVETTCLNRDLPQNLPFGGGGTEPRLQFRQGGGVVSKILCLTAPTPTLRPVAKSREDGRRGLLWRLVSHLSLNHLSLVGDGNHDRPDALREVLKLYDFADSQETRNQIDGLLRVKAKRVFGRVEASGPAAFTRGLEVGLQFDPERYPGQNLFLFASVLERFLGLYVTINSFTRTVATVKDREGEFCRWPPRMGEGILA